MGYLIDDHDNIFIYLLLLGITFFLKRDRNLSQLLTWIDI